MLNFAAIDFETANNHKSSVCSVGIVVVRDGMISEKIYELIRPVPNFYNFWNTKVHGLRYEETARAEQFPDVWGRIAPIISDLTLVAHNSPFDEGCLRGVHEHFGMEYPEYEFLCSCRMARKAFPKLPNHRLDTVSEYIGYDLRNHHHALADAEACASIMIKILEQQEDN